MLGVALFVLGQAGAAAGAAADWSGTRPRECVPLESSGASNVWERAKSPALRRYCDMLASGAAKLGPASGEEEAREALALAEGAARELPGRAAPEVLRGRALARLGRWAEAAAALGEARAHDDRALDDPAALFAWARAQGRAGHHGEAEAALHALLPRASSLAASERGKAEIEAALLAEARGAPGLAEAVAMWRQSRRDAQDALKAVAVIGLALALDRAGERAESRAILAGDAPRDPRGVALDPRVREALDDAGAGAEGDALVALALEGGDAQGARDAWAKYLAGQGGKGPWGDHARARAANGGGNGNGAPRARGGR